jgi:precorrin-8X/cobalt-precorrin-8 methylmutase
MQQSFAVIDQEIGVHDFSPEEYAIVRRIIHSTADFEFKDLIRFSPEAIATAIAQLSRQVPIVTDVSMVKQGILTLVKQTFGNPVINVIDQVDAATPGKTRTETGILKCFDTYPEALFVIGNAPTALMALCHQVQSASAGTIVVVGTPVGFISVLEAKAALAQTGIPQIRVEGRKGGSAVAAAIVNALLVLAWERATR